MCQLLLSHLRVAGVTSSWRGKYEPGEALTVVSTVQISSPLCKHCNDFMVFTGNKVMQK